MSGGSSAPTQQQVTSTTSNLPEYARPYFENLMNRSQAESYRDYTPYADQRIAGFTPEQQQVQQSTMGLQTPGQFGQASDFATVAGLGSLNAGQYNPSQYRAQQIGQPNLTQYQMGSPGDVQAQGVDSPSMGTAQTGYNPNINYFNMGQAQNVSYDPNQFGSTPEMQAAQTGYNPNLQNLQMQAPQAFGQAQADQYMSPYFQNVIDPQKREAILDAKKTQLAQDLGAVRQGTYGGARQLLAATERERALGQNLNDIQGRGLQAAYENAQSQYERDRSANMTAGQANLQAGLQTQQLGAQTGLQTALANLSSEQQANVQNQAAQLQMQGMNAEQAMRAALANQQADLTVGQQNLSANNQNQQLGVQTGLQAALANLSSEQQSNVQNLAAQLQTQGLNADQAMRAALANQQTGLQVGQQNLNANLQTQQLGAQTGLQALLANQQTRLQTQQLNENSRQFGSTLGMQGYGQTLEAGRTLGNLGLTQQQADLQRLGAQGQTAAQQQQLQQQQMDMAYADFLRQRDYPMEQLGYYSNMLRGLPVGLSSTQTSYAPPPSAAAQIGGLGLGALGLYNTARG